MGQAAVNPRVVRFGLFELDLDVRELRKSGVRIKLQEQPFLILATLVERPGAIVTREELHKRLWPEDTFVDFDLSLNSAVKKLRQALNDDSENPRFVETLYRRGYRFIGPVHVADSLVPIPVAENGLTSPPERKAVPASSGSSTRRKRLLLYAGILALVLLAAVGMFRLIPSGSPRVLGYTQITHDGLAKATIYSDGERIYFQELQGDRFGMAQVSAAGGEASLLPTPFENAGLFDVAPNGSALLLGVFQGTGQGNQLWSLPLPSGTPRRLGDAVMDSAKWSPDGSRLVFSWGPEIYEAGSDGSEPRKLARLDGQVFSLRFSPDGGTLRFDVVDPRNGSSSLWEMRRDGTGLRPLLPGWNGDPREESGGWTPDGKYFLFESLRGGRASLWALPEKSSWLGRELDPVQLTNGPLNFRFPVASKDGKRIFTVGTQPRCELIRYDNNAGFVPFLEGISASDVAFSADGEWIAYVSIPERQLWRSHVDGRERLQLTFDPMLAGLPRWSPDGKQIVFMSATPKTGWRVQLISRDGTALRELITGADNGYDPGWSPDGKSILLTLNGTGSPGSLSLRPGIATFDLETRKVSLLPGAKQLFSPRWSPDGKYIAAITDDSQKLVLFDRATQKWEDLVSMPIGYPSWSHDGQYIYFDTTLTENANIFRVRISDRKLEHLVSLRGVRRYWGNFGSWTALGPDDSPLLNRDTSSQEIYALDWQAP